ncbi:hypothetical protein LTR15_012986 [Elasticomyces elasticus]|nr:hypothetical protein LTR15_012986 [Elasticomyces elasticus]
MVGPFFDLLATRQVKAEAIQPDQTGAKYSVIAHILNYRQLPAHLRLRVTNRMNALLARIDHSSTGLQWLVLGPGGRLIRRDVQHNLTRVAWAQNQRDSVVRYMRTINARYAYDAGAMLSGTKERFRMAPYTRLSMDAVRLALAVRPYTSEDAIMDDCYTASARVACYAAFSCDIIDYKEAGVDYANWFDDGDVASSVVPALFVGYEWFWHACRWLACMRHGLEAQADPDLDLMIQELQTIGKLLHKLAKDTTNPDKQLAELVWKSVKADGLALVAEESNPSPKDPEQEFDYGFGICNKLSPHFTPFLVFGAGIRATPYIDVIKNNADWMDMAHFQNEEV